MPETSSQLATRISHPTSPMAIIRLKGLEFFAYHGYHAEERTIGNRYRVDLEMEADASDAAQRDDLSGTINYEEAFIIVRERMAVPARLLEHVGYDMVQALRAAFPKLKRVQVEVTKFNPPLGGVCEAASVLTAWPE